MSTSCDDTEATRAGAEIGDESDDRPSFVRVEDFLGCIEDRRKVAQRTRWIGLGVAATVAGVAFLTAIGAMPVQAENVVVSATAVVAALKLGSE